MDQLLFRFILPEEFSRLEEIFTKEDWAIPNPSVARILVGEDSEGQIKAINVVQTVLHVGPAYIAPEYRHQGVWREPMEALKKELESVYGGVILVATSPAIERIAQFLDMQKSGDVLYLKDFNDEIKGGEQ